MYPWTMTFRNPGHGVECSWLRVVDPTCGAEEIEELLVRLRLAESFVGDDVRSHVERSLDGELQRVLDEAFLSHVRRHELWLRDGVQLRDARLHHRETLGNEVRFGLAPRRARRSRSTRSMPSDRTR
jgi:hypothetical protein